MVLETGYHPALLKDAVTTRRVHRRWHSGAGRGRPAGDLDQAAVKRADAESQGTGKRLIPNARRMSSMATTTAMTAKQVPSALVRYAWVVVAYNILVILWGALYAPQDPAPDAGITGLSVTGRSFHCRRVLDTIIEFTHRCMTGGAISSVPALLIWTFRKTIKGQAHALMAVASTVLLVNEAILELYWSSWVT